MILMINGMKISVVQDLVDHWPNDLASPANANIQHDDHERSNAQKFPCHHGTDQPVHVEAGQDQASTDRTSRAGQAG